MTLNPKQLRGEARREFWRGHISDWKGSEISTAKYCDRHRLSLHVFIYWKKKFEQISTQAHLVPVSILPSGLTELSSGPATGLSLRIGERFHLEIGSNFAPDTLRRVVETLEAL